MLYEIMAIYKKSENENNKKQMNDVNNLYAKKYANAKDIELQHIKEYLGIYGKTLQYHLNETNDIHTDNEVIIKEEPIKESLSSKIKRSL